MTQTRTCQRVILLIGLLGRGRLGGCPVNETAVGVEGKPTGGTTSITGSATTWQAPSLLRDLRLVGDGAAVTAAARRTRFPGGELRGLPEHDLCRCRYLSYNLNTLSPAKSAPPRAGRGKSTSPVYEGH